MNDGSSADPHTGSYRLKLTFTPKGASRAVAKTIKVKVVKRKAPRRKVVALTNERGAPKGIALSRHQPRRPAR